MFIIGEKTYCGPWVGRKIYVYFIGIELSKNYVYFIRMILYITCGVLFQFYITAASYAIAWVQKVEKC